MKEIFQKYIGLLQASNRFQNHPKNSQMFSDSKTAYLLIKCLELHINLQVEVAIALEN